MALPSILNDPKWILKLEFASYLIYILFILITFWIAHWLSILGQGFFTKVKEQIKIHPDKKFFTSLKEGIAIHYLENKEDISTLLFFIWIPLVFTILSVIVFNL